MARPFIEKLFLEALQLNGSERDAFLAEISGDVRKEVESLLAADTAADGKGFLDPSRPPVPDAAEPGSAAGDDHAPEESTDTILQRLDDPDITSVVGPDGVPESLPLNGDFGDFQIVRRIGRGGMGDVYEALQESLRRRVALKVLRVGPSINSVRSERFRNEATAAAKLHHPNIVPIFSNGDRDGLQFLAMHLVEGQDLATIIRGIRDRIRLRSESGTSEIPLDQRSTETATRRTDPKDNKGSRRLRAHRSSDPNQDCLSGLSAEEYPDASGWRSHAHGNRRYFETVARIGLQAALALEHAHECGVRHRDIKPGNLMIDVSGHLWVTDFGLAQLRNPDEVTKEGGTTGARTEDLTLEGDILGTLRYMSPEQASGRRGFVDDRTDVYSLGATLYELLTLRSAIQGKTQQEVFRLLSFSNPVPMRRHNPNIPVELEVIIQTSMARDPVDRYETAGDFALDLQLFIAGEPIKARKPSIRRRCRGWLQQHRALARTIGVALCVTFFASLAVSAAVYRGMLAEKNERLKTEEALVHSEGMRLLANSALLLQTNPGLALILAVEGAERVPGVEADAALIAAMDANHEIATLPVEQPAGHLAASRDGRWVVSSPTTTRQAKPDAVAEVYDVQHKSVQARLDSSAPVTSAAFDESGRWLITTSFNRYARQDNPPPVLWDSTNWKKRHTFSGWKMADVNSIVFSRNGARIVLCGRDKGAAILSTETGEVDVRLPLDNQLVANACFDMQGNYVATVAGDGSLSVWDSVTGGLVRGYAPQPGADGDLKRMVFTFDAAFVAVVRQTGTHFYSVKDDENAVTFFRENVVSVSRSDPRAILALSYGKAAAVLNTRTLKILRYIDTPLPVTSLDMSGPNVLLHCVTPSASASVVHDAASGALLADLKGHIGPTLYACFGADPLTVYSAGRDSTVRHWDVRSGRQHRRLSDPSGSRVSRFSFSSKGSSICVSRLADSFTEIRDIQGRSGPRHLRGKAAEFLVRNSEMIVTYEHEKVIAWDAATQHEIGTYTFTEPVLATMAVPGLQKAVLKTSSGDIWLWDAAEGNVVALTMPNEFADFDVSSASICVATSSGVARLIDPRNGQTQSSIVHSDALRRAHFSGDGKRLVTLDRSSVIRVWDLADLGAPLVLPSTDLKADYVKFVQNDKNILSFGGYGDHSVNLWNAATGELIEEFPVTNLRWIFEHPLHARLCLVFEDRAPILWNLEDHQRHTLDTKNAPFACFLDDRLVTASTLSRDVAAVDQQNDASIPMGVLQYWDISSGERIGEELLPFRPNGLTGFPGADRMLLTMKRYGADVLRYDTNEHVANLSGHAANLVSMRFTNGDKRVVTASQDGLIRVFDLEGQLLKKLNGHASRITASDVSPDGKVMVSGDTSGRLVAWDLENFAQQGLLEGHTDTIETVKFSSNVLVTTTARDGTIRLWDLRGVAPRVFTPVNGVVAAELSPDGTKLLVVEGAVVTKELGLSVMTSGASMIDVTSGAVTTLNQSSPRAARYSGDGRHYAILSRDGSVFVHDAATNALINEIQIKSNRINAMSFAPDGTRILTWQSDGFSIWGIPPGPESLRVVFEAPPLFLWDSRFQRTWNPWSPDGKSIITQTTEFLWWTTTPLETARDRRPRVLSSSEAARFEIPDFVGGNDVVIVPGNNSSKDVQSQ
jgi:WD40 repeat protein/serine/threonine protein kinase